MATSFLDHVQPNIFQSTFNFHESVPTCKKSGISSLCYRDIVDLKILQPDWPGEFWAISQEPDFYLKYGICTRMQQIIWSLLTFPPGQTKFSKYPALSNTTPHEPLTPCWVSEKTDEPIPRKLPARRKDRQTLIHRTIPVTAKVPIG